MMSYAVSVTIWGRQRRRGIPEQHPVWILLFVIYAGSARSTACPLDIFHDNSRALAEILFPVRLADACVRIEAAAGRERHDQADGLARIALLTGSDRAETARTDTPGESDRRPGHPARQKRSSPNRGPIHGLGVWVCVLTVRVADLRG